MTIKTSSVRGIISENVTATSARLSNERWMNRQKQLCWKCQGDKPLAGGTVKFFGTVRRFICKDCVDAKKAELAKQEAA